MSLWINSTWFNWNSAVIFFCISQSLGQHQSDRTKKSTFNTQIILESSQVEFLSGLDFRPTCKLQPLFWSPLEMRPVRGEEGWRAGKGGTTDEIYCFLLWKQYKNIEFRKKREKKYRCPDRCFMCPKDSNIHRNSCTVSNSSCRKICSFVPVCFYLLASFASLSICCR